MSHTLTIEGEEEYRVEDRVMNEIITPEYPDDPFEVLGENTFRKPIEHESSSRCNINETPVQEFFRDAVILITGASGFLGQVLLEKLLRSCPGINHIHLLIRGKENYSPQQVLEAIFENRLFKRLKYEVPDYMNKLSVITGDVSKSGLGLSNSDTILLQQTVNIVYHCAANVRFDATLLDAVMTNSCGTNGMINLVKLFTNLKGFVYLSTAFSFCPNSVIDETVPATLAESLKYEDIMVKLKTIDPTSIESETRKIITPWPNPYVFSKALTESLIANECSDLPVGIFRPSAIISTYREPVRGWINSFQGFLNGCLGIALGIVHVCYVPKAMMALDMVPVDLVVNALICAAKDVHDDFQASKRVHASTQSTRKIPIYNYVNGGQAAITWKEFVRQSDPYMKQWCSIKSMWYPSVILTYNRFLFVILWLFLHIVAGFLLDVVYLLSGRKPMLTKTYKKYFRLYKKVGYFSCREWSFRNERVRHLWSKLSSADRQLFFFDMKQIDWKVYLASLILGGRTFVLKEPISSLPAARRRMKRLHYLHLTIKYSFICLSVISAFSLLYYNLFSKKTAPHDVMKRI